MRRGLAETRQRAHRAIEEGLVLVSGSVATKPARLVDPSEPIELAGPPPQFVSRGGEKLAGALDAFGIDPSGWRCLDVGASTGGFTDCLLQRGAASVVALDVGRDQLDWSLRNDPRVSVIERTDVREASGLGRFDLVVADVSFISLVTVLPAIASLAGDARVLALVKPQFEVGRRRVGKGGVVKDPALHAEAVERATGAAAALGYARLGLVESPIRGADGNREFFLWLGRQG